MKVLLPASTLLALCAEATNAAQAWIEQMRTEDLRVSVVSVAQAQAAIQSKAAPQEAMRLETDLDWLLKSIEADAHGLLAFTDAHARVWKALIHDPALAGVSQLDRQVYAVAMAEGLTIVESARAVHGVLRRMGILVTSL